MLSKNNIKYIKSLIEKKHRNIEKKFLVEWEKSLKELLESDFLIDFLVISPDFEKKYFDILQKFSYFVIPSDEISKISTLKTNQDGVAIVMQKENIIPKNLLWITLVLDRIQDPWNLGTIIRIADWYGVKNIIASLDTCELYNPKTIMSSMWSFLRVWVYFGDIENILSEQKFPIYGAFIEWENIHTQNFPQDVFLIIWNEWSGISDTIAPYISKKITIPRFWQAESLNAWIATGIILDNIIRKRN